MTVPTERDWERVEEIAERLQHLPPGDAEERLRELQSAGEAPSIITLVRTWLALPAPVPAIAEGDVVDSRYTLVRKLADGGMGSVWLARQMAVGREVAVKFIPPSLVSPALVTRFGEEVKILGRLDHPGIVKIFDAGLFERGGVGVPFFVMEYVPGEPLVKWAERQRDDRRKVVELMCDVCEALQHAHDRKIVHRDLKPGNILVREDGRAVVLDFGISRIAGVELPDMFEGFSGTPHYSAPEQHLGKDRDFRSGESVDVFAAGAVFFELLAGRRLFQFGPGATVAEMRRTIVEGTPPRLAEVMPDCPALLDDIVAKAVRRDPADRYFTIAGLRLALLHAIPKIFEGQAEPPPWTPAQGKTIPGTSWKLDRMLGRGAAGEVWLGHHEELAEQRVFKFCDTEEKARSLRREMTLFRLLKQRIGHNPHFVRLHDVVLEEPPRYLMMDCVEALDLAAWCDAQPGGLKDLAVEARIEIVAQAAEALQVAHDAGILHRDIKPGNLLVGKPPPDGPSRHGLHVYVADFGIGQIVTEELQGTMGGFTFSIADARHATLSGTVLYLAPEVIEGGLATAKSDLYSLGVVFWQLLAGDLRIALDATDGLASITDTLLREDLVRCLARTPEQRWSSAGEFAARLRALPERRAEEARRKAELAAKERAAYRRGVIRTTLAGVAIVVVMGILGLHAWRKSEEAADERKKTVASHNIVVLGELGRLLSVRSGGNRQALSQKLATVTLESAETVRAFRGAVIPILAQPSFERLEPPPMILREHDHLAGFGDKLAVIDRLSGLPEYIDLAFPKPHRVPLVPAVRGMTHLRINPRSRTTAAIAPDGRLHVWFWRNSAEGGPPQHRELLGPIHESCYALSPNTLSRSMKSAIAIARPDGAVEVSLSEAPEDPPIRLLRRSTPTEDAFPESFPATLLAFGTDPEGVLAVADRQSNLLKFWQIDDRNGLSASFTACAWHPDLIRSMAWRPRGPEVATGCADGTLRIWRYSATGVAPQTQPLQRIAFGEPVRDLAWSSDGEWIAALLDSGKIRVCAVSSQDLQEVAAMESPGARRLGFFGSYLLVAWSAESCASWGVQAPCFAQRLMAGGEVQVGFHRDGALTASALEVVHCLQAPVLAWSGGFTVSGGQQASWMEDTLVYRDGYAWKYTRAARDQNPERLKLQIPPEILSKSGSFAASPNGMHAALRADGQLRCLDAQWKEIGTAAEPAVKPALMAVSDAGPITARLEGNVVVIRHHDTRSETSKPVRGLLGLTFAGGGRWLACRTYTGVSFVETESGAMTEVAVTAPSASRLPIASSADGQWLAVCGANHEVIIGRMPPPGAAQDGMDKAALQNVFVDPVVLTIPSPKRIISLAWDKTGDHLACGTSDGFVQLWNLSLLRQSLRLWKLDWSDSTPRVAPDPLPVTLN